MTKERAKAPPRSGWIPVRSSRPRRRRQWAWYLSCLRRRARGRRLRIVRSALPEALELGDHGWRLIDAKSGIAVTEDPGGVTLAEIETLLDDQAAKHN